MDQILNTGTNLNIWFNVIKFSILVILAIIIFFQGMKVYKAYKNEGNYKKQIIWLIFPVMSFILVFIFLFVAFGSGRKLPTLEEVAPIETIKNLPDELTKEEIIKKAMEAKPDVLKRQDSGFAKEAQEADEYIKKALENR